MRTKSLSLRPGRGCLIFGRHQLMGSLPPWRMLAAGRDALLDATMMFSRAAKERFDIRSPVGCPSLRGLTRAASVSMTVYPGLQVRCGTFKKMSVAKFNIGLSRIAIMAAVAALPLGNPALAEPTASATPDTPLTPSSGAISPRMILRRRATLSGLIATTIKDVGLHDIDPRIHAFDFAHRLQTIARSLKHAAFGKYASNELRIQPVTNVRPPGR